MDKKIEKKPLIFAIVGLLIPIFGVVFSIIALNKANKLVDECRHWSYVLAMVLGGLGIMAAFSAALAVVKAVVEGLA